MPPLIDLENDELDLMRKIDPVSFFSSPKKTVVSISVTSTVAPRRSLRVRKPTESATPEPKSRKRTLSTSAAQNSAARKAVKKIRLDDKKAVTAVSNDRKDARDRARKLWLLRHRDLFEPLLPSSSNIFETLEKDVQHKPDQIAFVPFHELDEQPKLIQGGNMKEYQLHGLSYLVWMYKNGMNCLLGDEMGLGKTLQTLSLFAYIKENASGPHDPHLVICPLSVLSSWQAEASRWLPSMRSIRFHGPGPERERLKNALRGDHKFDILITTYEAYVAEDGWFKTRRWTYCVLDEGHKIKNAEINVSHKLQGLGSLYRLILTGTPVQNDLLELWGLLHWLYPTIFTQTSERLFKDSFDISKGSYALPFVEASKKLISKIMLRRTKAVIEADVPPREELTVFIPLTETQRFWTYRLLTKMDTPDLQKIFGAKADHPDYNQDEVKQLTLSQENSEVKAEPKEEPEDDDMKLENLQISHVESQSQPSGKSIAGGQWKKLMNLLMQLRKVCDHPYLLPNAEPIPYELGEHIITASSKLIVIDKLLADILPKGERVLIFSQWTGMLDVLEDFLNLRAIPYARLDGSTSRPRRSLDIKLFQQEKSPYKVFLVSTRAGGLGINLTRASTVIMCDSDWNPQSDLQAIARAHRIGQTKIVKVYRLICRGSVEDQMLDRIRRKLFLSVKIMGNDNPTSSSESTSMGSNELMNILRKGSSALTGLDGGMDLAQFLASDISEILKDSQTRETRRDAKIKDELKVEDVSGGENKAKLIEDAEEEERRLLSGVAQVRCRLFEGKIVQKSNKEIAAEWVEVQKRARVDRTVVIDGMTFITSPIVDKVATVVKPVKRAKAKFDSEEYCIYCRDGGTLVMCSECPRVFHANCQGITQQDMRRPTLTCQQHSCCRCFRTTSESGGMLFRCQTCPQAFCEDCLPPGDIDAVGDVLPEFELLNYGQKAAAYYIRCQDCHEEFERNPSLWKAWEEEMRETEVKLAKKYASE